MVYAKLTMYTYTIILGEVQLWKEGALPCEKGNEKEGVSMKRLMSWLLVVCMVLSMLPGVASAAENEMQVQANNEEVSLEGTNQLGDMLVEEIQEAQEGTQEANDYAVLDLTVEEGQALVHFNTRENANLVVALYTEDGVQMVCSGTEKVTADQTEATVSFAGAVPQYFYARAFLLDNYDHSPLCQSYATPMYTREMQELLASTAEDYEQDRVLTLDEDTSSNFLVYQTDTLVIRPQDGVNTMTQADDENRIYVIENADSTVTSLQEGDVFAYEPNAMDVVIVKIAAISVEGTTVTVTGQDVELQEAFSHVKLEQSGDAGQLAPEEGSQPDEGITFEGVGSDQPTRALEGGTTLQKTANFKVDQDVISADHVKANIKGTIKLKNDTQVAFYASLSHQYVYFRNDTELILDLDVTGKLQFDRSLGTYSAYLSCFKLSISPKLQFSFSATMSVEATLIVRLGFAYNRGEGFTNLCGKPEIKTREMKFSGSMYVGFDLNPKIAVVDEHLMKIDMKLPVGFEIKGELYQNPNYETREDYGGVYHKCQNCIALEMFFRRDMEIEVQFLNCKHLKSEMKARLQLNKIEDMHYCVDENSFGWGLCPNIEYRVTVAAEDNYNNAVSGAEVRYDWQPLFTNAEFGTTNESGTTYQYLDAGFYTFRTQIDGKPYEYSHNIKEAGKVVLGPNVKNGRNFIAEKLDPYDYLKDGRVLLSGSCGEDLEFILYSSGHLVIEGTGPMTDFAESYKAPWYYSANRITRVIVGGGVTSIGKKAFYDFYGDYANLKEVYLPDDLEVIGEQAFEECVNLQTINFPSQLTTIGQSAFDGCRSLEEITIPSKVTTIAGYAFRDTRGLKKVYYEAVNANTDADYTHHFVRGGMNSGGFQVIIDKKVQSIPANLFAYQTDGSQTGETFVKSVIFEPGSQCKKIGNKAFYECLQLEQIILPEGVTEIGDYAFEYTPAKIPGIPSTVTSIGKYAFDEATGLQDGTLPASLTSLGTYAFSGCTALKNVSFNSPIATIPASAFRDCTALEEVRLFDNLVTIDSYAFSGCSALKEIAMPNTVTTINQYAFQDCASLEKAELSSKLTTIGNRAFESCGLEAVVIPDSVTKLGTAAFQNNGAMKSFHLGKGVTSLDPEVLFYNHSLETLTVSESNTAYVGKGNCIISKGSWSGKELVVGCKNSVIPTDGSVTKIGESAFQYNAGLTSITIPSKVSYVYTSAFANCTGLKSVTFEGSKISLSGSAFANCTALESIVLPKDLGTTGLSNYVFKGCTALKNVTLGASTKAIGTGAFSGCTALETIVIPAAVTKLNSNAFQDATSLTAVVFEGNAPTTFNSSAFKNVTATIYYPQGDTTWDTVINNSYGGTLTWTAYAAGTDPLAQQGGQSGSGSISAATQTSQTVQTGKPATRAIYPGDQESAASGDKTLHTATFENLVAGQEYVFLAVKDMTAADLLAADNLLYIWQAPADENGVLTVEYIQREELAPTYIMACGASRKDLSQAQISFPAMYADGSLQAVKPTVTYEGQVLNEGNDYTVSGTVDFTQPGTYTCYIRGIYDYSGTVECQYTVESIENANVTFADKVYHNLRLQDLTKIGYAFQVQEPVNATYGVLIWTDLRTEPATVESEDVQNKLLTYDNGFYTAESDGIYAQRLDTTHYARPYAKIGETYFYGNVDVYSPLTYAQTAIAGDDASLKQLMIDFVNYGARAQVYFAESKKVDPPAELINHILTPEQKTLNWSDDRKVLTPTATKQTANTLSAQWYGTNLNLLEAIRMNMAATGSITGMYYWNEADYHDAAVLDSTTASGEAVLRTDGKFTIGGVTGIVAQGIYDTYYVCCYDADGNLGSVRADSVAAYATRLINSEASTQATVEMAKALIIYGNSAHTYFAENN